VGAVVGIALASGGYTAYANAKNNKNRAFAGIDKSDKYLSGSGKNRRWRKRNKSAASLKRERQERGDVVSLAAGAAGTLESARIGRDFVNARKYAQEKLGKRIDPGEHIGNGHSDVFKSNKSPKSKINKLIALVKEEISGKSKGKVGKPSASTAIQGYKSAQKPFPKKNIIKKAIDASRHRSSMRGLRMIREVGGKSYIMQGRLTTAVLAGAVAGSAGYSAYRAHKDRKRSFSGIDRQNMMLTGQGKKRRWRRRNPNQDKNKSSAIKGYGTMGTAGGVIGGGFGYLGAKKQLGKDRARAGIAPATFAAKEQESLRMAQTAREKAMEIAQSAKKSKGVISGFGPEAKKMAEYAMISRFSEEKAAAMGKLRKSAQKAADAAFSKGSVRKRLIRGGLKGAAIGAGLGALSYVDARKKKKNSFVVPPPRMG
jgi:hypothetical protein